MWFPINYNSFLGNLNYYDEGNYSFKISSDRSYWARTYIVVHDWLIEWSIRLFVCIFPVVSKIPSISIDSRKIYVPWCINVYNCHDYNFSSDSEPNYKYIQSDSAYIRNDVNIFSGSWCTLLLNIMYVLTY